MDANHRAVNDFIRRAAGLAVPGDPENTMPITNRQPGQVLPAIEDHERQVEEPINLNELIRRRWRGGR